MANNPLQLEIMHSYAWCLVGRPYIWGGDDPLAGFDCSGLVQEILASVGEGPPTDLSAQGLYRYYQPNGRLNCAELGSLAFYGKSVDSITHVALLLDRFHIVEAGGGGSETKSLQDAIQQNAYVRVRRVDRRKDLAAIVRPCYKFEHDRVWDGTGKIPN